MSMSRFWLLVLLGIILRWELNQSFRCNAVYSWKWNKAFVTMREVQTTWSKPFTAVMIVPTGVGAKIGGYAGDALPSAKLLASSVDLLITHPNVMNGAMLYWPIDNILYVEGSSLDAFAANQLYLEPLLKRRGQKIGLLLDQGIEEDLMLRHIQVAESMKATLGLDIAEIVVTSAPAMVTTDVSPYSGASWGTVKNLQSLIEGAQRLKEKGCTAIAVVARFPEGEATDLAYFEDYRKGEGVDAIAGVEAIISRILSQVVGLPVAHAPAFSPMDVDETVSPKAAAEEIGYTFLPCVLANLHRAPNLIAKEEGRVKEANWLQASDVDAVVVPFNSLGGPAVLSFLRQGKLILAVRENETSMEVSKEDLLALLQRSEHGKDKEREGEEQMHLLKQIKVVHSYAEAAGYLLAHRHGIHFEAITSKVNKIPLERL